MGQALEQNTLTQRPACALRALAHALNRDKEEAFLAIKSLGEPQESDRAETLLAMGSTAFLLGNLSVATAILRVAHQRRPAHPIINARLGASLLGIGRQDAALPFIEKAAELLPTSGGAWLNVAHVRLLKNDFEGALAALKTAEPLQDKEPEIYDGLMSDVLQKLGRGAEAEALLRARAATGQVNAVVNLIRQQP